MLTSSEPSLSYNLLYNLLADNLKYCKNYQNIAQRHNVNKYCVKNWTSKLVQHMVATNFQSEKNTIPVKLTKVKNIKMRYVCKLIWIFI